MTDKQIIDVTKCIHFDESDIPNGCNCYWDGECNHYCYYKKYAYEHQECEKLKHTLTEIKEIAEGMHDFWINKTEYADINNLVKHLLECELNRIRYKLDKISEVK